MSNNNSSALSSILSNKLITTMTVLLLISIVAFVPAFFLYQKQNGDNQEYLRHAGELRVLSQELAKNASEAGQGSNLAFASLKKSQQAFDRNLRAIMEGDAASNLPSADIAAAEIGALNKTWKSVKGSSQVILSGKEAVLYLHKVTSDLAEKIPSIQQEYDDVVEILLEVRAPSDQIAIAQRQTLLAERIVSSANKVLEGGENAVYSAESFEENAVKFGEVLDGMINGNDAMQIRRVIDEEALDSLSATRDLFEFVKNNVKEILDKSPELFQVTQAVDVTFTESGKLLQQLNVVNTVLLEEGGANVILQTVSFALVGLAVIFIIIIATLLYAQTQKNLKEEAETNEANQNAIMRLLDELADLGDGDLSVQATVTEDFTGAIADAFNFSVEQMRSLVSNINDAAVQVSSAAQETQATAMHLAEASDHQAQEIAGASAAVNEMAVSIDQVSANASESSSVAERSVAIANKGGEVVRNTISGMDNIRGQIQETSKRIKRLGESTQEIGDIVSLINDIADQTNILALNASIQASMAGDAGRGFAVVADEVQRLAERSGAATKQIEALVKTIQNDTNEAVISMEQTTTEVVKGAHLAQDAGVSLEEIETVSTNLAELIQNISNAARQQASSAGHISNTMNVIQEITSQTSSGTNATAASIGNLADMANRMRRSVEGFNLPEQETTDTIN